MLVNKLGVDVLLLTLCRLRFCKSFQSDNYFYYDLNNSALDFLIKLIIKLDKTNRSQLRLSRT